MGTPKSPIKRRICKVKSSMKGLGEPEFKKGSRSQTKTNLPGKKSAVLELSQEVSDEEAAQHEAHGEQCCVGVGGVDGVDDYRSVAGGVVVHDGLFHS